MTINRVLLVLTALFLTACVASFHKNISYKTADSNLDWDAADTIAFKGGRWFDGTRFVARDITYIVNRQIVSAPARAPVAIVSVEGKYIIPPLADAHTHGFDAAWGLPSQRAAALRDGVFYAMNMTAPSSAVKQIRPLLSGPGQVDVASAGGGITGPESHPAEIYEANALGFYSYADQIANVDKIRASRKMADNAYYIIENSADVEQKWPLIRQFSPDFVKVFLRSSERYDEGYGKWGPGGGIDPRLLPMIVAKAQADGWRTAVAVSSRHDFAVAANAGAMIATHPPCYQDAEIPGPYFDIDTAEECLLTSQDVIAGARSGMTLVLIASEWAKSRPEKFVRWEQANVAAYREAGGSFAIGSNAYGSTVLDGIVAALTKNLFPRSEILGWATHGGAKLAFPDRNIGCLASGCEASFLVLDGNPLHNPEMLRAISLRIKDGTPINPSDFASPQDISGN